MEICQELRRVIGKFWSALEQRQIIARPDNLAESAAQYVFRDRSSAPPPVDLNLRALQPKSGTILVRGTPCLDSDSQIVALDVSNHIAAVTINITQKNL